MHFPALTHQYAICIIESDNTKGQVFNMANEKLKFVCDYMEGAHPAIMNELLSTNMMQTSGYGLDEFSESARDKIRKACGAPNAGVYLLVGGTQTNATVIDALLRSYQGVLCAETGHIAVHEAGAIEFTGHKVIALPVYDGKLRAEDVWMYMKDYWQDASHQHFVYPGMVYISYPTEFGTLYTKRELVELASVCRWYNIPLYIDGARLGYGLMSPKCDITLPELAQLCDVFYIGGTKVGALFGEAAVFTKHNMPRYFSTIAKQHGALLAKGRLLGLQFDTLFTDDLYFRISKHAINMAMQIRDAFDARGLQFYLHSPTNLQFLIMENKAVRALQQKIAFHTWGKVDEEHSVARFATSWSTTQEDVDALIDAIKTL